MNAIIELQDFTEYQIWLKFNDVEEKVVDIRPFLGKEFTANLLDYVKFGQVFIEPGGGIAWPNGYDFCPNFLKELVGIQEAVNI